MKVTALLTTSLLMVTMLAMLPAAEAHPVRGGCSTQTWNPNGALSVPLVVNPGWTTAYTSNKFNHEYDGNGLVSTAVYVAVPCNQAGGLSGVLTAVTDITFTTLERWSGVCTYSMSTGPQTEDCSGHGVQVPTPFGDAVPVLCLYDAGYYEEGDVCGGTGQGNYLAVPHVIQSSTDPN